MWASESYSLMENRSGSHPNIFAVQPWTLLWLPYWILSDWLLPRTRAQQWVHCVHESPDLPFEHASCHWNPKIFCLYSSKLIAGPVRPTFLSCPFLWALLGQRIAEKRNRENLNLRPEVSTHICTSPLWEKQSWVKGEWKQATGFHLSFYFQVIKDFASARCRCSCVCVPNILRNYCHLQKEA